MPLTSQHRGELRCWRQNHTSELRIFSRWTGIAEDQVIMKSIALGWPDESFPANAVVSERKTVAEASVFVGFDS
jgi:hypothetical protein